MSPASGTAATGDGGDSGQLEERVDLSQEADAQIAQARRLVSASRDRLPEALALLGALEKRCRVGNDTPSLVRVCEASLEMCRLAGDADALISTLQMLAARRSQKAAAVKALVHAALPWCVVPDAYQPVDAPRGTPEAAARDKLVLALRDISDGKLYLERERAVLTRALATIREQEGDVAEAASVLQQVHVETYGSLSKRDKVEFILEQLRLTLATRDFVRAAIVAGKVSSKHLQEETMQEHKVRFYTLMTAYHRHVKDTLALAQDYHAIYSTPTVLQDEVQWRDALQSAVAFLVLAPHGNEQQDLLHRVSLDPNLEHLDACRRTVQLFLRKELISYPLPDQVELEALPALLEGDGGSREAVGSTTSSSTSLSGHWRETLHRRVVQHNLRVAAKHYGRVRTERLAQLLQLSPDRLEKELASMVSDGTLYAKIDRPRGIVRFVAAPTPESTLTDWAAQLDKLLHLVETTTHLIHKEQNTTVVGGGGMGGAGRG